MSRYDFSCPTCGRSFERTIPFNRTLNGVRCPAGHAARRIFALPAVIFKGAGWYSTDHARDAADRNADVG